MGEIYQDPACWVCSVWVPCNPRVDCGGSVGIASARQAGGRYFRPVLSQAPCLPGFRLTSRSCSRFLQTLAPTHFGAIVQARCDASRPFDVWV